MCRSMVDIQFATAEIRRGKKRRKKERKNHRNHGKTIMSASATQGGHKQRCLSHMPSQYGELWPTSGGDQFRSLGHPS